VALTHEFMRLPRSGETVFGFVAGLYPTEYPTLPEPGHSPAGTADRPDPNVEGLAAVAARRRDEKGAGGTGQDRSVD
jgi:hypothetical protein